MATRIFNVHFNTQASATIRFSVDDTMIAQIAETHNVPIDTVNDEMIIDFIADKLIITRDSQDAERPPVH